MTYRKIFIGIIVCGLVLNSIFQTIEILKLKRQISYIETDVDLSNIENEISDISSIVSETQENVYEIKNDVSSIEDEVGSIKRRMPY